jgi:rod shape-determining protein MreB
VAEGLRLDVPTVIAVLRRTRQPVAVGEEAAAIAGREAEAVEVVRPVRSGVVADVEAAAELLRVLFRRGLGRSLRRPRALLVVASHATPSERRVLREAAVEAGAAEAVLIENTLAAALGFGLPLRHPTGFLVADAGAGGFSAAVLALGGTYASRSVRGGGDAVDVAVGEWLRRHFALVVAPAAAEALKRTLGALDAAPEGAAEIRGRDLASGLPRTVTVSAEELAPILRQAVAPMVATARRALEAASAELAGDVAENGLWLTGGGGLLRGFPERLAEATGVSVHLDEHPLDTVAEGARQALRGEVQEDHLAFGPRVV